MSHVHHSIQTRGVRSVPSSFPTSPLTPAAATTTTTTTTTTHTTTRLSGPYDTAAGHRWAQGGSLQTIHASSLSPGVDAKVH